jgi:hypothetical protein
MFWEFKEIQARHDYPYNHDVIKIDLKGSFPTVRVYLHKNVPRFFIKVFLHEPTQRACHA